MLDKTTLQDEASRPLKGTPKKLNQGIEYILVRIRFSGEMLYTYMYLNIFVNSSQGNKPPLRGFFFICVVLWKKSANMKQGKQR